MAMGFMLAVLGLAGVVGSLVMPDLASAGGVPSAIWFCVFTQVFSFVCMLVSVLIDRHAKKVDPAEKVEKKPFQMKQLLSLGWPFWLLTASIVLRVCYIVPG
jgi:hypothetical protein